MRANRGDKRVLNVVGNQRDNGDEEEEFVEEFPPDVLLGGIEALQGSLGDVGASCQVLGQFCQYFGHGWRFSDETKEMLYTSTFNESLLECLRQTDPTLVKLSVLVLNHVVEQSPHELQLLSEGNLIPILLSKIGIAQDKDILHAVFRVLRCGCAWPDFEDQVKEHGPNWLDSYFQISNSRDPNVLAVFMSFMPSMVNLYPEQHDFIAKNSCELLIRSFEGDTDIEAWENVQVEILETYTHIIALPAVIDSESISALLRLVESNSPVTQGPVMKLLIQIFSWIDVQTDTCYLENENLEDIRRLLCDALAYGYETRVFGELMLSPDPKIAHWASTLLRLIISVEGVLHEEDQEPLRDVLVSQTTSSSCAKEDTLMLLDTLMQTSKSDEICLMYAVPEVLECLEDLLVKTDDDPKAKCVENSAFQIFLSIQRRLPFDHPYAERINELINEYMEDLLSEEM